MIGKAHTLGSLFTCISSDGAWEMFAMKTQIYILFCVLGPFCTQSFLTQMSAPDIPALCLPVRADRRSTDNVYCVLLTHAKDGSDGSPAFMFVQWSEGMPLPVADFRGGARRGGKKPSVPATRGAYVHGIMKGWYPGWCTDFTIQRYHLLPQGGVHAQAVALGLLPLFEPVIGSWDALKTAPEAAFPWQVCKDVATLAHDHFERVKRAEELYKAWYSDAPGLRRKYYTGSESYFATVWTMYGAAKDAARAYVQSVIAFASADGVADALAKMRARAAEGCMPMETMDNGHRLDAYTAVRVPIVVPGL